MNKKDNKKELRKGEIVIYKTPGKEVEVRVSLEKDTVWLTLNQIAMLFNTDKSGVSRHLKNIFASGELDKKSTVAKIATVQKEGSRRLERYLGYYNLDAVLSVGYRVNSKQATAFRVWATDKLKKYLIAGYAINEKRLAGAKEKLMELKEAIAFLEQKAKHELLTGQEREILDLLSSYSKTLTILEQYDRDAVKVVVGRKPQFLLKYESAKKIISEIKKELSSRQEAAELFGEERDHALEGIIGNLYQTFGGKELYSSIEEKAAHVLYLIIKDHPFTDGNKRIASFLFVHFLDKNNYLYKEGGEKKINDNALTALALLVAISDPKEKGTLIKIIINLLKS